MSELPLTQKGKCVKRRNRTTADSRWRSRLLTSAGSGWFRARRTPRRPENAGLPSWRVKSYSPPCVSAEAAFVNNFHILRGRFDRIGATLRTSIGAVDAQLVEEEGQDVGLLGDAFLESGADAVAGAGEVGPPACSCAWE